MAKTDQLLASYRRHVSLTRLSHDLPLSQRIWFVVYSPEDERRMVNGYDAFEIATKEHGLGWKRIDLTGALADWIDGYDEDERLDILRQPSVLERYADPELIEHIGERIRQGLDQVPSEQAHDTVFALTGLMELYDFVHVSAVLGSLDERQPGFLALFFPGERQGNTYRFLGARTGWDYLATPILAKS